LSANTRRLSYPAKIFAAPGKIARARRLENGKMEQGKNVPLDKKSYF
jgi:hypothetical protein